MEPDDTMDPVLEMILDIFSWMRPNGRVREPKSYWWDI
jgi:hypothetical protein